MGGAALHEQENKRVAYLGTEFEGLVIPFVLESTGRLGPAAVDFLVRHGANCPPSKRSALLSDLSAILAMSLGEMSASVRRRLDPVARRRP
jgi:hypothetical protein